MQLLNAKKELTKLHSARRDKARQGLAWHGIKRKPKKLGTRQEQGQRMDREQQSMNQHEPRETRTIRTQLRTIYRRRDTAESHEGNEKNMRNARQDFKIKQETENRTLLLSALLLCLCDKTCLRCSPLLP